MNAQIDLTGLHPIHFPVQPGVWPLSWGWYVIFGIFLLLILSFIYWKTNSPLIYANKELKKIQKMPSEKQLKLLSQLLKRVAMVHYGREKIAPLSENTWQDFLMISVPKSLSKDQAKLLAYAIYNPNPVAVDPKLFFASKKWIKGILKKTISANSN